MEETGSTESAERGWVRFSSYETVKQGKVSVLAIVETLLAMGVFVWIWSTWGHLHLMISACVAPLLLLRTENSQIEAFLVFNSLVGRIEKFVPQPRGRNHLWVASLSMIALILASLLAKVIATARAVTLHPIESICAIPRNWKRATVCVDTAHPEELLPGAHDLNPASAMWNLLFPRPVIRAGYAAWMDRSGRGAALLWATITGLFLLGPALAYRWSLKGSAFIYIPLLWILHSTARRTIFASLKDFCTLAIHKIALFVGVFSIGLCLFRYLMTAPWNSMCEWLTENAPLIAEYINPSAIPKWQLASAANGAIGIVLFLVADWLTRGTKRHTEVDAKPWSVIVRSVWFVRAVLSVYSIGCLLYISASMTDQLSWPVLGDQWWPW